MQYFRRRIWFRSNRFHIVAIVTIIIDACEHVWRRNASLEIRTCNSIRLDHVFLSLNGFSRCIDGRLKSHFNGTCAVVTAEKSFLLCRRASEMKGRPMGKSAARKRKINIYGVRHSYAMWARHPICSTKYNIETLYNMTTQELWVRRMHTHANGLNI